MNIFDFFTPSHVAGIFFGIAVFFFILTASGRFDSKLTKYLAWAAMAAAFAIK